MRPDLTFLARIYVEFPSGFRVGTGIRSHEDDNLILTDANGLPFIPGTSLTGAFADRARRVRVCKENACATAHLGTLRPTCCASS